MSGDQKLSFWLQNQLSAFEQKFSDADKDKSGSLSYDEVVEVLKNAGFKGTDEQYKAIFRFADANKDSKISRNEYMTAVKSAPKISLKQILLRRAFKKIDKDNSGFLTKDEIMAAAKSEVGLNLSAEKIAEMLIALVKDDDAKLDYEEFLEHFSYQSTANGLRELFDKIDKDKSGTLTKEEIINAIKADDELAFQAANISKLLVTWCKEETGKINYQEFANIVANQGRK